MRAQYERVKVRLRFLGNGGKRCTRQQWLQAIGPAIWEESARQEMLATAGYYVGLYNANRVFMYPFPLDLYRTRFLERQLGGIYQHFPWDLPDEDIHKVCESCLAWRIGETQKPEPLLIQGSAAVFLCPHCHSLLVDDEQADKAGATYFLTCQEFKERFGEDGLRKMGQVSGHTPVPEHAQPGRASDWE
ncbi:MAG: hypothetical protein AB7N91_32715 [Candidatus Tectimicrobiota bacterium]